MMLALYHSVVAVAFLLLQMRSLVEACEPLTTNTSRIYCATFGYNMTSLRADFRHQDEAAGVFMQFKPLIRLECSKNLKIFLCSFYFPMCHPLKTNQGIPPCRSLCLDVKSGCEPIMNKFGFLWPDPMKCTSFPKFGGGELCVAPNTLTSPSKNTTTTNKNNTTPYTTITTANSTAPPTTVESTTNAIVSPTTEEPNTKPVDPTKTSKPLTLKQQQKICWKGVKTLSRKDNKEMKKCCRYGKKIANVNGNGKNTCSLSGRKKGRGRNLMKKANRQCNESMLAKGCFESCCMYNQRRKQRKNNKRKNKRRS